MDVSESDAAYTIVFDVPGATREQLKVSVEGKRVVLSTVVASEAAAPSEGKDARVADARPAERVLYRERSLARATRAPSSCRPRSTRRSRRRSSSNGVLTLTLAKKVPAGATQLQHRLIGRSRPPGGQPAPAARGSMTVSGQRGSTSNA